MKRIMVTLTAHKEKRENAEKILEKILKGHEEVVVFREPEGEVKHFHVLVPEESISEICFEKWPGLVKKVKSNKDQTKWMEKTHRKVNLPA